MRKIRASVQSLLFAFAISASFAPAGISQKPRLSPASARVDINRASVEDLARLPDIGPKLAQQIIAYRTKHGPYHRVEDLLIIRGIGDKKWNTLRPHLCVDCSLTTPAQEGRQRPGPGTRGVKPSNP